MSSLFLLQGIFPTQGLNPGLALQVDLSQLSHKGSPLTPRIMPNTTVALTLLLLRYREVSIPGLWKCLEHTFLAALRQPLCPAPHRTPRVRSAKAALLRGQMLLFLLLPLALPLLPSSSYFFLPEDYSYLFIYMPICSSVHLKEHDFFINFLLWKTSNTCESTGAPPPHLPKTKKVSCFLCSQSHLSPPHSSEVDLDITSSMFHFVSLHGNHSLQGKHSLS